VEKAGIIKTKVPVVIGQTQFDTKDVFSAFAKEKKTTVCFADKVYKTTDFSTSRITPYGSVFKMSKAGRDLNTDFYCPLAGVYQKENLQTVFASVDMLKEQGINISDISFYDGIGNVTKNTGLKGRWQVLKSKPFTVCDTAHNEAGITLVLSQIAEMQKENLHIVLGMVNDKDISKILSLFPAGAYYYFCKPDIPRGLNENKLASEAKKFSLEGNSFKSVKEAFIAAREKAKPEDIIYVGGSTFVVAEVI